MHDAGVEPKKIRVFLQQQGTSFATKQDIYNRIAHSKLASQEGQSSIHALCNQLEREGFWSRMQFAEGGRISSILFTHPDSLSYLKAYPEVVLLDCTYKTNKYGMPLLDIVGIDACQPSFCIAFAFLSGEDDEDYLWALERLRQLYDTIGARLPSVILTDRCLACMNAAEICFPTIPKLLCLWHANKAVLRNCRPIFVQHGKDELWGDFYKHWQSLIFSKDEETYDKRLQELEKEYLPEFLEAIGYLKSTWLYQYKERLVKAFVDVHLHFDTVVTSRGEGIHALVKGHISISTRDLFQAWRMIKALILNQIKDLHANQAHQHATIPIELSRVQYSQIHGLVSHEAQRLVQDQFTLLKDNGALLSPQCTGTFSRSLGLPCAHKLRDMIAADEVLTREHFHQHWHLQRPNQPIPQHLLEPLSRVDRLVARSNKPTSSTRREPSGFETINIDNPQQKTIRKPPQCTRCNKIGHTRISKACPDRFSEILQQAHLSQQHRDTPTQASQAQTIITEESELTQESCIIHSQHQVHLSTTPGPIILATNHPLVIYQEYCTIRDTWYQAQVLAAKKTDAHYRKAMKLPVRYNKTQYNWCLD